MPLSRNAFSVISSLLGSGCSSQRQIADASGLSLGLVNETYKSLFELGYVEDYAVTDSGMEALLPYKVDNAIILAAGLSTRLAPISYDRPKGTLRVRGEVLIERQIRQLKEAGINDIVMVVGYKKEEYFYLEDKFGVTLVSSPEYMERNNHSSIWAVREYLGNSYVCVSDCYFADNPFRRYEYDSYNDAIWSDEAPDKYFLDVKGKNNRILSASLGGSNGWTMVGHAYWDSDFSSRFLAILQSEYFRQETKEKLWDEVFFAHAQELCMCARFLPKGSVFEFDSLDEVRNFDPEFICNVSSDALDNICATLSCERSQIESVDPIKQGLTNLSFFFSVNGEGYVYRHPGPGTNKLINRKAEAFALKKAFDLGLDNTFVHIDPEEGWKISRYVPNCHELDYGNLEQVKNALQMARRLHQSGAVSPYSFDAYLESKKIVRLLEEEGWSFPPDFKDLSLAMDRLVGPMRAGAGNPVLCHNDFYAPNFLVTSDQMSLIDWEYAAMGDYGNDFGNFVAQSNYYSVREALDLMPLYFGFEPSEAQCFHLLACTAMIGWYWYVWAMFKELSGAPAGEWLYVWYRSAKEFSSYSLSLLDDAVESLPELREDEFDALVQLERNLGDANCVSEVEGIKKETLLSLADKKMVSDEGIAPRGIAALEPYRVQRAVLLAAGFGSRLLPVTVNTPKPLARVNGVRIIDRLIDAVVSAGIEEIYVVRGYLAEEFDQLLAKYPNIHFIENPLYGSTNNISSAVASCHLFENAYVFESDLLLTNPRLITKYQYRSNYLGIAVNKTDDWFFDADENKVITNLAKGKSSSCWQMVGVSYWTKEDGEKLASDIPAIFGQQDGKQIFWDDVALIRKREDYCVHVRPCREEDIIEIDDFEDLQRIDPSYVVKKKGQ